MYFLPHQKLVAQPPQNVPNTFGIQQTTLVSNNTWKINIWNRFTNHADVQTVSK